MVLCHHHEEEEEVAIDERLVHYLVDDTVFSSSIPVLELVPGGSMSSGDKRCFSFVCY